MGWTTAMASTKLIQLGKYYYPEPGGMETHLYDLCCRLKDKYDLRVLVANTSPRTVREAVAGVSLVRAANWGELFSNPICPTFPRHLSGMKASIGSIIHLHLPNPMAHLAYALVRPAGKLVVSWHSDIVRQKVLGKLYGRALHALLTRADCIVATSPVYVRYSSFLRRHADKCVVVPLGINPEKFQTSAATKRRVQLLQSRYGRPFVLFVGRLTYYKGLDVLLQAADQINGNIVIVGNGPLKQQISNEVEKRRLGSRVFLLTEVSHSELVAFYHACDVFVLPSNQRSEAFGIVQLEAMVCGKPVVSTDLRTGVPWVNLHEVTGLTVPVNDAGRLAHAVNRLLADAAERRRLGRNGRRRVLQNFTLEKVGERMERVYEMVLDGGVKTDVHLWEDPFALGDELKANALLSADEKA
ncbi:glycosyltransferase [Candidatus Parcubacteria bacterium]|nr:MAG: glycosyltransferase [Candidatus Parcubacteria bacterium]